MPNAILIAVVAALAVGSDTSTFWVRKAWRRQRLRRSYQVPELPADLPSTQRAFARAAREVALAIAPCLLEFEATVAASSVHDFWPEGRRRRRIGRIELLDTEARTIVSAFLEQWDEHDAGPHHRRLDALRQALVRDPEPPGREEAYDAMARFRREAARWRGIFSNLRALLLELGGG